MVKGEKAMNMKNWSEERYEGKNSKSEQREYRRVVKLYNNSGYCGT